MKQDVSMQMGGGLIADKVISNNNTLHISDTTFENNILIELYELSLKEIAIEEHYDKMINSPENYYKIFNKSKYTDIIKALKIIIESRRKHLKKCPKQIEAIAFLHQKMKFSPTLIRSMVELFGVKLSISNILNASSILFEKIESPKWLQNIGGVALC